MLLEQNVMDSDVLVVPTLSFPCLAPCAPSKISVYKFQNVYNVHIFYNVWGLPAIDLYTRLQ